MSTKTGSTISGQVTGISQDSTGRAVKVNLSESAYLDYTVSETATKVSVTCSVKMSGKANLVSSWNYATEVNNVVYSGTISSQTGGDVVKTIALPSGNPQNITTYSVVPLTNKVLTYTREKTSSAQLKTLSFSIKNKLLNKTSSGSLTLSIPPRPKYTILYQSNGGIFSVTPYQDKWAEESITLFSSECTKEHYTLVSWNTEEDGSGVSYSPGATYTIDRGITLYAQWRYDYKKPTILTDSIMAFRIGQITDNVEIDDGEYIRLSFDYLGGTFDDGTTRINPSYEIQIDGSVVDSGTFTDGSGSYSNSEFGYNVETQEYRKFSVNTSHVINIRLFDDNDIDQPIGVTQTTYVSASTYPLDILADGSAMGVMIPATPGQKLTVPEELYITSSRLVYVIEEGESDGWQYRKWSDGRFEMWKYHITATGGSYASLGNILHYYRATDITFPQSCKPIDTNYHISDRWDEFAISMGAGYSRTLNGFSLFYLATDENKTWMRLNIYVTGKWK